MTTEKKIEKYKAERAIGQLTMLKMLKTKFEYQDSAERFVENLEYAISCIEKQIPKKPKQGELYLECPNCGITEIDYRYFPLSNPKGSHCPNCGQRISWEEEKC